MLLRFAVLPTSRGVTSSAQKKEDSLSLTPTQIMPGVVCEARRLDDDALSMPGASLLGWGSISPRETIIIIYTCLFSRTYVCHIPLVGGHDEGGEEGLPLGRGSGNVRPQ